MHIKGRDENKSVFSQSGPNNILPLSLNEQSEKEAASCTFNLGDNTLFRSSFLVVGRFQWQDPYSRFSCRTPIAGLVVGPLQQVQLQDPYSGFSGRTLQQVQQQDPTVELVVGHYSRFCGWTLQQVKWQDSTVVLVVGPYSRFNGRTPTVGLVVGPYSRFNGRTLQQVQWQDPTVEVYSVQQKDCCLEALRF